MSSKETRKRIPSRRRPLLPRPDAGDLRARESARTRVPGHKFRDARPDGRRRRRCHAATRAGSERRGSRPQVAQLRRPCASSNDRARVAKKLSAARGAEEDRRDTAKRSRSSMMPRELEIPDHRIDINVLAIVCVGRLGPPQRDSRDSPTTLRATSARPAAKHRARFRIAHRVS